MTIFSFFFWLPQGSSRHPLRQTEDNKYLTANMASLESAFQMEKYAPTYAMVFDFEKNYDHALVKQYVDEYWLMTTILACTAYVIVIFGIQRIMQNKQR